MPNYTVEFPDQPGSFIPPIKHEVKKDEVTATLIATESNFKIVRVRGDVQIVESVEFSSPVLVQTRFVRVVGDDVLKHRIRNTTWHYEKS